MQCALALHPTRGRWPPLLLQLQASETLEIARKYRIGRTSHRIASQLPMGGAVEEGAHRSAGPQYRCVGEAEVWWGRTR
jgi:hypothetical protein